MRILEKVPTNCCDLRALFVCSQLFSFGSIKLLELDMSIIHDVNVPLFVYLFSESKFSFLSYSLVTKSATSSIII